MKKKKKLGKVNKISAKELADLENGDISDIEIPILKELVKEYKMSLKEVKKIVDYKEK